MLVFGPLKHLYAVVSNVELAYSAAWRLSGLRLRWIEPARRASQLRLPICPDDHPHTYNTLTRTHRSEQRLPHCTPSTGMMPTQRREVVRGQRCMQRACGGILPVQLRACRCDAGICRSLAHTRAARRTDASTTDTEV